ncbi:MAG TPA: MaoC family dehydratase [Solirubrobacteraceae bacterium]|nr:MaoC family dehydratase [Solirubrobacteraceae bacterium]
MLVLNGVDAVRALVGQEVAVSGWHEVTQADINTFADVTGDHQFIHVDPERAKQTPFGGTIAHGYYTLSLMPMFIDQMVEFTGFSFGLNYGINKLRFPAPLPVGANVRLRAFMTAVEDIPGGIQMLRLDTFETDAADKPVCVAETVTRLYV